jgi:hypothetical protein
LQELGASASNSLQFLTPTNPLACFPKWTMTLNQNAYCAQLVAGSSNFFKNLPVARKTIRLPEAKSSHFVFLCFLGGR